jgi:sugar phosphate isomerase/epimerase
MNRLPVAAQMYTVREAAAKDLPGALRRIADLGYRFVELAGLFDQPAGALARVLRDLGLVCVSAHVPLARLRDNLAQEIETYQTLGANYIVCPWLPPEQRGDAGDYAALGNELNRMGEQSLRNGLQLCYHHHDFELTTFDGRYALDILLDNSDPAHVKLEADTYWLQAAGLDPAAYLRRWPGRVPLVHLKDMSASTPPVFAEVGAGILDWPQIFEAARVGGAQWYIVEQDSCPGDPFESLRVSLENLKGMAAAQG